MKTQTPKATAKEFFKAHPNVVIRNHFREKELSPALREALFNPRTARTIRQKEIIFDTSLGQSALGLNNLTHAEIDGDLLHIAYNGSQPQITYQALCG